MTRIASAYSDLAKNPLPYPGLREEGETPALIIGAVRCRSRAERHSSLRAAPPCTFGFRQNRKRAAMRWSAVLSGIFSILLC